MQTNLFCELRQPIVVSDGLGVDSMAMLVGMRRRKQRPDAILHAAVGAEKEETDAYLPIANRYLREVGFPEITVVRYVPQDFKNWPPYYTLEENCLTNGTLPSISFGFQKKSCSQKWKAAPQNAWVKAWPMAIEWWKAGGKVLKVIGYDASPSDARRRTYACDPNTVKDTHLYDYWYPLQDWGWTRDQCEREIAAEGLPVPPKSSCIFCASMQPWEVAALPPKELRRIVRLEARAAPRLVSIKGLWGYDQPARPASPERYVKSGKNKGKLIPAKPARPAKPGSMTQFILDHGLLPATEVAYIIATTPKEIVSYQEGYRSGAAVPPFGQFMEHQLVQIGEQS